MVSEPSVFSFTAVTSANVCVAAYVAHDVLEPVGETAAPLAVGASAAAELRDVAGTAETAEVDEVAIGKDAETVGAAGGEFGGGAP